MKNLDDKPEQLPENGNAEEEIPPIEHPIEPTPEPEPEPEPEPPDGEGPDGERVAAGGECSKCGWKWGDSTPHEIELMPQNIAVPMEATPAPMMPPTRSAPDPNACPPIALQGTCPKCGWSLSHSDPSISSRPHPTL